GLEERGRGAMESAAPATGGPSGSSPGTLPCDPRFDWTVSRAALPPTAAADGMSTPTAAGGLPALERTAGKAPVAAAAIEIAASASARNGINGSLLLRSS